MASECRGMVEELYREHQGAPFPAECRCRAVRGYDLIHLDANTMGCVSTFLQRDGRLDPWWLAVLGLCYRGLTLAAAALEGEARDYFVRLEKVAGLVLEGVRDSTGPD